MKAIKKFILKDVRCFEGEQEFNIRPLTFLMGANSTGKSTVLGCIQALGNFIDLDVDRPTSSSFDFNADPYQLGTFSDIARKNNKGVHPQNSFSLGFEMQVSAVKMHILVTLTERKDGSDPSIEKLRLGFDNGQVIFKVKKQHDETDVGHYYFDTPKKSIDKNGRPIFNIEINDATDFSLSDFDYLLRIINRERAIEGHAELCQFLKETSDQLSKKRNTNPFVTSLLQPYVDVRFESFAPIRSKPMRTYNPVKKIEDPEGSGMPMTLINMYRNSREQWQDMRKNLVKFGKSSRLFTDVDIKQYGGSVSDPFQLQIKPRGYQANIIDVGYGVGQILPVLVRIFNTKPATIFLMQQPEVHLHPEAQAELCSLLIKIAKKYGHSFVVETHSDYMVNRARFHIRKKGGISADDVSLIYFEPAKSTVTAHNITFDECANFIDLPPGYGEFFLKESDRVLGFRD